MDKAALLGTPTKAPKTGQLLPNRSDLLEPFADRESVVKYHCSGCGFIGELTREVADKILGGCLGIYQGNYIECDECSACGRDLHNAELESIIEGN